MKTKNNISRIALIVSIAVPFIMASCSSFDPEPVGLAFNYDHVDDFSFGAGAGTGVPYLHVDSLIRYDSTNHTFCMKDTFGYSGFPIGDFEIS